MNDSCFFAIGVALYMFLRIFTYLRLPSSSDAAIITAKYNFIRDLLEIGREKDMQWRAYFLALVTLFTGSVKVAFIGGGLTLAVAIVGGGCTSLLQLAAQWLLTKL